MAAAEKEQRLKAKEMNPEHRAEIVRALVEFKDCKIAKVYDKWHFYFNKQQLLFPKEGVSLDHRLKPKEIASKDTEIIPFHPNSQANSNGIKAFMDKYITKPYQLGDNTVGVEVNFNKEFYVPETVESVETILAEIADIDRELNNLENELGL